MRPLATALMQSTWYCTICPKSAMVRPSKWLMASLKYSRLWKSLLSWRRVIRLCHFWCDASRPSANFCIRKGSGSWPSCISNCILLISSANSGDEVVRSVMPFPSSLSKAQAEERKGQKGPTGVIQSKLGAALSSDPSGSAATEILQQRPAWAPVKPLTQCWQWWKQRAIEPNAVKTTKLLCLRAMAPHRRNQPFEVDDFLVISIQQMIQVPHNLWIMHLHVKLCELVFLSALCCFNHVRV